MNLASVIFSLLALVLLQSCTSHPRFTQSPSQAQHQQSKKSTTRHSYQVNQVLRGSASWYGPKFHGRKTANGETFNMNALSAAHKTLPLGSWIQVKNLANDRVVEVKVNDRGPYAGNRILDLSRAAAQKLDFIREGVTEVEIRILSLPGK